MRQMAKRAKKKASKRVSTLPPKAKKPARKLAKPAKKAVKAKKVAKKRK